jgi:hypothetical protein
MTVREASLVKSTAVGHAATACADRGASDSSAIVIAARAIAEKQFDSRIPSSMSAPPH